MENSVCALKMQIMLAMSVWLYHPPTDNLPSDDNLTAFILIHLHPPER